MSNAQENSPMQPVIHQHQKNFNSLFAGLKLRLEKLGLEGNSVASLISQGPYSVLKVVCANASL